MRELKIGTSSVRGVIGDALTPELIVNFAAAFGTWTDGRPVVLGRDARRSATMVRAATVAGLLSPGCEIIDLGLAPTPLVAFAVREFGAGGGISLTGSHNDHRWNALKFIGPDGTLLNSPKNEELLDIYHASAFKTAALNRTASSIRPEDVSSRYVEHVLSAFDVAAIRAREFRVAIDFCNGTCGPIASKLLEALNCKLLPLNERPAARFSHQPSPTVANMQDLAEFMASGAADLGAALNVDGDRIAFVTADGVPLSEEYTLPLAAEQRFRRRPGTVVTNLSTSRMIDVLAASHDQQVIRTAVGEGHVLDRGLEESAVLAGEGSGGVGALPITTTFDGLLTLCMVLESMATSETPPGEIRKRLPHYIMRKGEVPCSADQVYRLLERFRNSYDDGTTNDSDGVRVDWPDAWIHIRASATEPLLRIIVEAESQARAEELYESALTEARSSVSEI